MKNVYSTVSAIKITIFCVFQDRAICLVSLLNTSSIEQKNKTKQTAHLLALQKIAILIADTVIKKSIILFVVLFIVFPTGCASGTPMVKYNHQGYEINNTCYKNVDELIYELDKHNIKAITIDSEIKLLENEVKDMQTSLEKSGIEVLDIKNPTSTIDQR